MVPVDADFLLELGFVRPPRASATVLTWFPVFAVTLVLPARSDLAASDLVVGSQVALGGVEVCLLASGL